MSSLLVLNWRQELLQGELANGPIGRGVAGEWIQEKRRSSRQTRLMSFGRGLVMIGLNVLVGSHQVRKGNHEQTNPYQPPNLQPPADGNRRVRFPGGTCLGHALVVESCHRRSVAAA